MKSSTIPLFFFIALFSELAQAAHPCTSPLVLDLDDNGVRTTTLNYTVDFDLNADGFRDTVAWIYPAQDAFLWQDLNGNGHVDDGTELFGDSTIMPDGGVADNGFVALGAFDKPAFGGNDDGLISAADEIWRELRLWIDSNFDGKTDEGETFQLSDYNVVSIDLTYTASDEVDGGGNLHVFKSTFARRVELLGHSFLKTHLIEDIIFASPTWLDGDHRH